MAERDAHGRFVAGNTAGSSGGLARAARQTPEERAALARSGLEAVAAELGVTIEDAARYLAQRGQAVLRRRRAAEQAALAERTPGEDAETP